MHPELNFMGSVVPAAVCCAGIFTVVLHGSVELPYSNDFEAADGFTSTGILVSDPDWVFDSGLLEVEVIYGAASSGSQSLLLTGTGGFSLPVTDSVAGAVQWVDFYVKPLFAGEAELLPLIAGKQSAVSAFIKNGAIGEVFAVDGDGMGSGSWVSAWLPISMAGQSSEDWLRLSYRLDYAAKRWDLFVDGRLVMIDLGFIDNAYAGLSEFTLTAADVRATGLDDFHAGDRNPMYADADNDGIPDADDLNTALNDRDADPDQDLLTNIEEFMHGTDPDSRDSDSDLLSDSMELKWGRDPNEDDADLSHLDSDGIWTAGFEPEEGYRAGNLDQQLGWSAYGVDVTSNQNAYAVHSESAEVFAEHFFGTDPVDRIWFCFDAKLHAGVLPDPATLEGRTAAVFAFSAAGTLHVLDADSGQWLAYTVAVDPAQWNQYAIFLNYQAKQWDLYLNGEVIAAGLDFCDPELQALSRFKVSMQKSANSTAAAYMDQLKLYSGNDFDADGLGDAWERAFGFSPAANDSDGNATPDYEEDTDGDGLTALEEYQQGHLPTVADADVDYYVDQAQGDDALYNGQSAFPGAPTIEDGPKHTVTAAIAAAADADILLLQPGTYNETTLRLNGKNLILRPNGRVAIQ